MVLTLLPNHFIPPSLRLRGLQAIRAAHPLPLTYGHPSLLAFVLVAKCRDGTLYYRGYGVYIPCGAALSIDEGFHTSEKGDAGQIGLFFFFLPCQVTCGILVP